MTQQRRLEIGLLVLRLGVFVVMAVWTLDKFVNPTHAAAIFENFYFLPGTPQAVIYLVALLEGIVVLGFVLGLYKRLTYGAVLVLHGVSTLSSLPRYLAPFDNLLFFAAGPMLAACLMLYLLRDDDRLAALG